MKNSLSLRFIRYGKQPVSLNIPKAQENILIIHYPSFIREKGKYYINRNRRRIASTYYNPESKRLNGVNERNRSRKKNCIQIVKSSIFIVKPYIFE